MPSQKRSTAVPLVLVPALAAATGCGPSTPALGVDPCKPNNYSQQACEYAVANKGYYNQGTWFPMAYAYAPLFYYNGYSRFVAAGGRARALPMSSYSPTARGIRARSDASRPRTAVVRGGFGGIGGSRGFGGG